MYAGEKVIKYDGLARNGVGIRFDSNGCSHKSIPIRPYSWYIGGLRTSEIAILMSSGIGCIGFKNRFIASGGAEIRKDRNRSVGIV